MKKKTLLAAALALMVLFSGCAVERDNVMVLFSAGDQDLMQIGDLACPVSFVKVFLANYQNIYGEAYGINLWQHDFGEEKLEDYIKEISVSDLARIFSMYELALEEGKSISDAERENAASAAEEYFSSLSEEELEWIGIDEEALAELYLDYAVAEELYRSQTENVDYEVSEDEARVMTIQEIYVTDSASAALVESALSEGTDFATLAAQYTENPQVERNIKRGDLPAEVEAAAYSLDVDEISPMIETEGGWYFIRCVNKNVEDLTAENKLIIVQTREREASDDVYDAFVDELPSTLNRDLYDSLEPKLDGSITTKSFFTVYEKYFG